MSEWVDGFDGISHHRATRYIVQVPVSIGGRAFLVSTAFVDLIWPTSDNKSEAVASGTLVIEAGSVSTVHFCSLLP